MKPAIALSCCIPALLVWSLCGCRTHLDVTHGRPAGILTCGETVVVERLLQRREHRFRDGTVPTNPGSIHGLTNTLPVHQAHFPGNLLGECNWSSQHWFLGLSVSAPQRLRSAFSTRGSCGSIIDGVRDSFEVPRRTACTGRYPSEKYCSRSPFVFLFFGRCQSECGSTQYSGASKLAAPSTATPEHGRWVPALLGRIAAQLS